MDSVVLRNVSKIFPAPAGGEIPALQDVSLEVAEGELLVLVGPSGSGKTTLLRAIAGFEAPTSGTILIGNADVTHLPPADRGISMTFPDHPLYPHMTVRENIGFGLKLRKTPKPEIDLRVRQAADKLGLEGLMDRNPEALSGGERQRVSLARAVVLRPGVFLMDEPLSNLDGPLRAQMRREIARLHRELGTTTIYVTHDQGEAMLLADRLAVIQGGSIQQVGKPVDLYDSPGNLFVAGFLGAPPMNFFRGTLAREGGGLWFRQGAPGGGQRRHGLQLEFDVDGDLSLREGFHSGHAVIAGLRGEHIHLVEAPGAHLAAPAIDAAVELVETLGWEKDVWLRVDELSFIARTCGGIVPRVGERVPVFFDTKKMRLFDATSGQRIAMSPPSVNR